MVRDATSVATSVATSAPTAGRPAVRPPRPPHVQAGPASQNDWLEHHVEHMHSAQLEPLPVQRATPLGTTLHHHLTGGHLNQPPLVQHAPESRAAGQLRLPGATLAGSEYKQLGTGPSDADADGPSTAGASQSLSRLQTQHAALSEAAETIARAIGTMVPNISNVGTSTWPPYLAPFHAHLPLTRAFHSAVWEPNSRSR
jgi:hypothetical protein